MVQTQAWSTKSFPYRVGVFQGDPLSVAIFNMITCLFADAVLQSELNSAYRFEATGDSLQLLSFADDAVLMANSVQNLQKQTDAFLLWSNGHQMQIIGF